MVMPNKDTVDAFVAMVESGDYVGAIERFYDEDASMQENNETPRVGRATLVNGERQVMAAFRSITAQKVGPAVVDGDRVGIRWCFAFAPFEGPPRTLEEIAWQRWRDERIVEEKFFYDPKQVGR
jgi:ketosteroid isomerase-like protein